MGKIPVKKILKELGKLDKYDYPGSLYSLFILPDGRMVGIRGMLQHQSILEEILNRKITVKEFVDICVATGCIKVGINHVSHLSVDIAVPATREQKYTLEGLGLCNKYAGIEVDVLCSLVPGAPSINYCRRLLKLPFK